MANSSAPTPLNPNAQPWPLLYLPHQIMHQTSSFYAQVSPLAFHYPPATQVVPYYYHMPPPPSFTYYYQVPPPMAVHQPEQYVESSGGIYQRGWRKGGDLRMYKGRKTTVMIRNIPNQYSRDMLVNFLDEVCREENSRNSHKGPCEYDFVYLPFDFKRGLNLGYAFVNFTSPFFAGRMFQLKGYKWGSFADDQNNWCDSKKVCYINWARIQGTNELVRHFQHSRFWCDNINYLPVLFTPPRDGSLALISPTTIGCLSGPFATRDA